MESNIKSIEYIILKYSLIGLKKQQIRDLYRELDFKFKLETKRLTEKDWVKYENLFIEKYKKEKTRSTKSPLEQCMTLVNEGIGRPIKSKKLSHKRNLPNLIRRIERNRKKKPNNLKIELTYFLNKKTLGEVLKNYGIWIDDPKVKLDSNNIFNHELYDKYAPSIQDIRIRRYIEWLRKRGLFLNKNKKGSSKKKGISTKKTGAESTYDKIKRHGPGKLINIAKRN